MNDVVWVSIISALGLIMSGVLVELIRNRKRQDKVVHEVQPNSGSSLRDVVNRIETSVNKLDDKVDHQGERLVRVETRIEDWGRSNV